MPPRRVKPGKGSSPRKRTRAAVSTVTKKVRMTEEDARRLAAAAKALGTSESEVLRKGIEWAEKNEDRRKAIKGLVEMAIRDGPDPGGYRWEGRVWPEEDRA